MKKPEKCCIIYKKGAGGIVVKRRLRWFFPVITLAVCVNFFRDTPSGVGDILIYMCLIAVIMALNIYIYQKK